jgi:hypothetical protein
LQNDTKVVMLSSPGLTGGSSVFKDFLDSGSGLPRTGYGIRNDGKRIYSKVWRGGESGTALKKRQEGL